MSREKTRDVPPLREEIVDPDVNYRPRTKRKKSEEKKVWHSPWQECPFCFATLPVLPEFKDKRYIFVFNRVKECPECGAKEIPECPACKHPTWVDKDGNHKHKMNGCGFFGKRKVCSCSEGCDEPA